MFGHFAPQSAAACGVAEDKACGFFRTNRTHTVKWRPGTCVSINNATMETSFEQAYKAVRDLMPRGGSYLPTDEQCCAASFEARLAPVIAGLPLPI